MRFTEYADISPRRRRRRRHGDTDSRTLCTCDETAVVMVRGGRRHLRTNKSFTAALFLRENGSVRATGERNEKPNRRKKKTLLFPPRTDYRRVLNTGPNIMFLSRARAPAHTRNRDKITHRTIGRDANDDSICILYESKVYKYNIVYKVSLTGNTHKAVFTSIPGRRQFC